MDIANGGKLQWLPIDDLVLDLTNPRIAQLLEVYAGDVPQEAMLIALGAESETASGETTYHSLKVSIQTNGGIIHPIVVNDCDDGLVVIEGNTRTLIYRELKEKLNQGRWSNIPSLVYKDLSQRDIDAIRLQAHLVGPRQWDPYSKAKYLDHLRNSEHLTWDQIVDFCGGQSNQARDYVSAYNDMEAYYRTAIPSDDRFNPQRFSSFVELQRPRVLTALSNHGYDKSDFAKWVVDDLLVPQNLVRSLPNILDNKDAREVFLADGAREAVKELHRPSSDDVLRDATLAQLAAEISRRVFNMSYGQLTELRDDLGSDVVLALTEARDNLDQLCKDLASE